MGAILTLLGGVRGIAMIALIVAALGWVAVQHQRLSQAQLARDQAIVQRDTAARERDKAIEVSRANQETIARLEQEKADINLALNNLAAAQANIRASSTTRQTIIQNQANVPSSRAIVAPVIASIISEVQADRIHRRAAQ